MNLFNHTDIARAAQLSDCGRYRYLLSRTWRPEAPQLGWVMLNPSTADALQDDPTIRRCMGFARAWDFGGIVVANLFHLRATDPAELLPADLGDSETTRYHSVRGHAVGVSDDWYGPVFDCPTVIAAWGSHDVVTMAARDTHVRALAQDRRRTLHALAINRDGQPRHPLYVPASVAPVVWFQPAFGDGGTA